MPLMPRSRALGLITAAMAVSPGTASAEDPIPLKVSTSYSDSYAEPFYAQDAGFFKRFGLDVEFLIFGNGSQTLTAAITGNADICASNPVAIVQAIQHGVPITCVAGDCYYTSTAPTTGLFVASSSAYRDARDLEGHVIAVLSVKDFTLAAVEGWLQQHGADSAKVQFVEMPATEMAVALKRGTVAAANMPEPYITAASADIRLLGKSFDAIAKRFYINVWAARPAFVQKNAPALKRFIGAVYATAKWANTHHEETVPILAKYAKMEPSLIRNMTRATYASSIDPRDLQPTCDAAFKQKLISGPVNAADLITRI